MIFSSIFKKESVFSQWLLVVVIIFFIMSAIAAAACAVFEFVYEDRVYPGVSIGGTGVGGYDAAGLIGLLNKKIDRLNQNGIVFRLDNLETTLYPLVSTIEGGYAYQLINFDAEKTVDQAMSFGRKNGFFLGLGQRFGALLRPKRLPIIFTVNDEEVKKILANNFNGRVIPAENASLSYELTARKPYAVFKVNKEKLGQTINYGQAITELKNRLAQFDESPIALKAETDYPVIFEKDCLNIEAKAERLIETAPVTLFIDGMEWSVERKELLSWLALKTDPDGGADEIIVGLNSETVKKHIEDNVAAKINQPPVDAKFEIKDGRVVEFQASRDGIEVAGEQSALKIETELLKNGGKRIELITKKLKSTILTETINSLGIKQIIGIGESNFAGSPKNRRHNIQTGADALNGLLIKPAEEFSLINALGDIDATTGYLPELVIKNNRTIPEFGGGLCQIGTTMFRTALATGLPITMRRNHSYRVTYYEPAGTDATIYDPWPDFKFINDTGSHILIQSRIEGDLLYFDFWGTPDGRIATRTDPVISNIIKPGPAKIIETLDLKPGEKKCTEKPHNGADTYFDYTVTYPPANPPAELKEKDNIAAEDLIIETRFKSHYVPWREVCLLGVEKLSEVKTATSTEAVSGE